MKSVNVQKRKIPMLVADIENRSTPRQTENDDGRRTTFKSISTRRSTNDQDHLEQTRSAPSSPALSHISKQRLSSIKASIDPIEHDDKSVGSEYGSSSINGPSDSLSSGTLEVRLKFDAKNSKMWIFVLKASLEMTQRLSKQTLVQVHLTVLPNKRVRYRTRVKPIDNAMFAEEFFCKVSPETIQSEGIRFRLYTYERFKRIKLLAEAVLMFAMVNLDEDMCKIVRLERAYPSEESDLDSRSHLRRNSSVRGREETSNSLLPELEIGLAYDQNQSMLVLEIGKGINFRMGSQGRAPNTYVHITLRDSSGKEIISNRTMTRHAQHHPVFAERYPFNIHGDFLEQITLVISVMKKKSSNKTDQTDGCISFGREASGNAQLSHWNSMLNGHGETITRWHSLLDK